MIPITNPAKVLLLLLLALPLTLQAQNKSKISYPVSLTVAADGSGDYTRISAALQAFRAYSPVALKLYIRKGVYKEKVVIPHWICNLTIEGEQQEQTIITFDDYSGKQFPGDSSHGKTYNTFNSYTLAVYGNDIHLKNLTIRNTTGCVGQAVALHVEGDRVMVEHCRLLGNQDTLFTGNDHSRQYYSHCFIEGTTDFIFGPATVLFEDCELHSLSDSYITAASTSQAQSFGYVFLHCRLTAAPEVRKVYLGRPWRKYARTVFIGTEMISPVAPEGWHNWNDPQNESSVFYAEYKNTGPGAANQHRVTWSKQLDGSSYATYTRANILGNWTPSAID